MEFGYFYQNEPEQFAFYRIPRVLFTDDRFKNLTTEGKVLYGLLLDRVSLSRENGWIDEHGRIYIIFTLSSIRKSMNCAEKTAIKYLTELEIFGLIERIRQGMCKPSLIYVKNFTDQQKLQFMTCNNSSSPSVETTVHDLKNYRLIILITIILNLIILILSYQRMRRGWDMKHIWMNSLE